MAPDEKKKVYDDEEDLIDENVDEDECSRG